MSAFVKEKRHINTSDSTKLQKKQKITDICLNSKILTANDNSLTSENLLKVDDTFFAALNFDNLEQAYWTKKNVNSNSNFIRSNSIQATVLTPVKKKTAKKLNVKCKKWPSLSLKRTTQDDLDNSTEDTDNCNVKEEIIKINSRDVKKETKDEIMLSFDVNSCFQNENVTVQQYPQLNVIPKKNHIQNENIDFGNSQSKGFSDDLSQFYESPLVLQQIDSVLSNCNTPSSSKISSESPMEYTYEQNKYNEKVKCAGNSFNTNAKIPQPKEHNKNKISAVKTVIKKLKEDEDNWNETIAYDISQFFKSTQYKREVEDVFNNLETTICQISEGQDSNLQKEVMCTQSNINNMLNNIDWTDESMLNMQNINEDNNPERNIQQNLENIASRIINDQTILENVEFVELGPFYGLPSKVKDLIHQYKGIEHLYDWQDECLKLDAIKRRINLVYALPTSGGKTLVSEILILRELLCRKHNVIFVLPYVSIVQEKVWALSPFAIALDFLVEEYAAGKGCYPPRKRRHKHSVYVATIEKALGVVNSLTETDRLNEIGLVVVDELHLLGESSRGVTLETLLTKLIYAKANIHIVGMSATIGNLSEVCTFLKAEVYTKDFRPVELKEYVKCEKQIFEVNRTALTFEDSLVPARIANFAYSEAISKIDPDRLAGLVMEVIPTGSCLLFCPSKKNCENVALLICRIMPKKLLSHKKSEKEGLLNLLHADGTLCPILKRTLPYGIAYHHSGLTSDERRLIEDAFRVGTLCVICCTSTLAAGVNLPAQRVILRSPYIGREFINLSRYKQMVGRAGRAGMGEIGESILLCERRDLNKVAEMLCSPMDQVESKMCDNDLQGLRSLILSCIGLGTATTRLCLRKVCACTLLAVQEERLEKNVKKATDQAITDLFKMAALQLASDTASAPTEDISVVLHTTMDTSPRPQQNEVNVEAVKPKTIIGNNSQLIISKLGKAAIKGCFDLETAHVIYEDLVQAQYSLVLLSCLHLLYLVTPYDLAKQIQPSPSNYYSVYSELGQKELQTARVLGINEACEAAMLAGRRIKSVDERVINRFYLTMILHDLWNEKQVFEVADKYQVSRGIVQQLMVSAATFASNLIRFCQEFEEFWSFVDLLHGMSQRLQHCSSRELEPLMELPSVKQARARQLYKAGYKTLQSIAKANPNDLINNIEHMSRRIANQLIASAKLLLLERVENLREEAEDVLDGIDIVNK